MSAVTAVPLRPLARGAVLKLWIALLVLVLAAAGLAWWGTQGLQIVTLDSGVRYRVVAEGSGPAITPADAFVINYRLHANSLDGRVIESTETSGQPYAATTAEVFPGFAEALQHMRSGGRYQLWLPPGTHIPRPLGPGAPFTPADTLVFEVEVTQVAVGRAADLQMQRLQQMMQQQQSAPPAGGAPQPGAAPPPPSGGR